METTHNLTEPTEKNRDINYLKGNRFQVVMDPVIKNVDYTVVEFDIPGISTSNPTVNGGVAKTRYLESADTVEYEELSLRFLVDENMNNYKEMHDWILGTVTEEDNLEDGKDKRITILVYSSHNNLVRTVHFENCKPISLSPISFRSGGDGITDSSCSATFTYTSFTIQ